MELELSLPSVRRTIMRLSN